MERWHGIAQSAATLLTGKWTYRSFLNDPRRYQHPNKAAEKLLALLFAEAVFTFEIPTRQLLKARSIGREAVSFWHGTVRTRLARGGGRHGDRPPTPTPPLGI